MCQETHHHHHVLPRQHWAGGGLYRSPIRLQEKLKHQYWLAPLFHCSTLSIDPLIPLLPEQRFGVLLS